MNGWLHLTRNHYGRSDFLNSINEEWCHLINQTLTNTSKSMLQFIGPNCIEWNTRFVYTHQVHRRITGIRYMTTWPGHERDRLTVIRPVYICRLIGKCLTIRCHPTFYPSSSRACHALIYKLLPIILSLG